MKLSHVLGITAPALAPTASFDPHLNRAPDWTSPLRSEREPVLDTRPAAEWVYLRDPLQAQTADENTAPSPRLDPPRGVVQTLRLALGRPPRAPKPAAAPRPTLPIAGDGLFRAAPLATLRALPDLVSSMTPRPTVVFDIDDTLLHRVGNAHQLSEVHCCRVMDALQSAGTPVFLLTARHPRVAAKTLQSLDACGIKPQRTSPLPANLDISNYYDSQPPHHASGVVYTGNIRKGVVLGRIATQVDLHSVIMVDDNITQLSSMAPLAHALGLPILALHYVGAKSAFDRRRSVSRWRDLKALT